MVREITTSKNLGGRPRHDWTSSRNRKLVRLYTMTLLNYEEIMSLLRTENFNPKPRSVQAHLKTLLPDDFSNATFRQYRPADKTEGRQRLAQLKKVKAYQLSRYRRAKERTQRRGRAATPPRSEKTAIRPFCGEVSADPHYDFASVPPPGAPSPTRSPFVSRRYPIQPSIIPPSDENILYLVEDEWRSSDKEVLLPSCSSPSQNTLEPVREISSARHNDGSNLQKGSPPPFVANTSTSGMKRTYSELTSNGSVSTRSFSQRLSTRASNSLRHARSVLSFTNTESSSFIYQRSLTSAQHSTDNLRLLSHNELVSWEELVDESRLSAAAIQYPVHKEASLQLRSCCLLSPATILPTDTCNLCGCSKVHQTARLSTPSDGQLKDVNTLDHFGNTPLHYAAAAGNTANLLQLMSYPNIVRKPARNAFGETFMHVLHLDGCERFAEFFEVVKAAERLAFPFKTRDYYGRTVAHRIHELPGDWYVEIEQLKEVYRILEVEAVLLDSRKDRLGLPTPSKEEVKGKRTGKFLGLRFKLLKDLPFYSKFIKSEPGKTKAQPDIDSVDNNGDTRLLAALKGWPRSSKLPKNLEEIEKIIRDGADIHIRDRYGYTPLAVASRLGLRPVVLILLNRGANVNTRSYQGTSLYSHLYVHMERARREKKDTLYAGIVCCMDLLTARHAKHNPTVYDEYTSSGIPAELGDTETFDRDSLQLAEIGDSQVAELTADGPSMSNFGYTSKVEKRPTCDEAVGQRRESTRHSPRGDGQFSKTFGGGLSTKRIRVLAEANSSKSASSEGPKTKSPDRCSCGYQPGGEPKFDKTNLARHKRLCRSAIQKQPLQCSFPGCEVKAGRLDRLPAFRRQKHGSKNITEFQITRPGPSNLGYSNKLTAIPEGFVEMEDNQSLGVDRSSAVNFSITGSFNTACGSEDFFWTPDRFLSVSPVSIMELEEIETPYLSSPASLREPNRDQLFSPKASAGLATSHCNNAPEEPSTSFPRTDVWSWYSLGTEDDYSVISPTSRPSASSQHARILMDSYDESSLCFSFTPEDMEDMEDMECPVQWSESLCNRVELPHPRKGLTSNYHREAQADFGVLLDSLDTGGTNQPTVKSFKGKENDHTTTLSSGSSSYWESILDFPDTGDPGPSITSSRGKQAMKPSWGPIGHLESTPEFPDTGDPWPVILSSKGQHMLRPSSGDNTYFESTPKLPDTGDPEPVIPSNKRQRLSRQSWGPGNRFNPTPNFPDTGDPGPTTLSSRGKQVIQPEIQWFGNGDFIWDPGEQSISTMALKATDHLDSVPEFPDTGDPNRPIAVNILESTLDFPDMIGIDHCTTQSGNQAHYFENENFSRASRDDVRPLPLFGHVEFGNTGKSNQPTTSPSKRKQVILRLDSENIVWEAH